MYTGKYYYDDEHFKLIKGDTFKVLKKFEDKTIDTIFADPPYEGKTDLSTFLGKQKGYKVEKDKVYYKDELVARVFKKHQFYSFLEEYNINWKEIISKQLLPDDCIYVIVDNTLFIIECKFQQVAGSVDEKLQTCDFKKKQYQKLLSRANIEVEYVYLLRDWFKKPQYKDVLDYIISVRCQYYFEYIPLKKLGLPVPEED